MSKVQSPITCNVVPLGFLKISLNYSLVLHLSLFFSILGGLANYILSFQGQNKLNSQKVLITRPAHSHFQDGAPPLFQLDRTQFSTQFYQISPKMEAHKPSSCCWSIFTQSHRVLRQTVSLLKKKVAGDTFHGNELAHELRYELVLCTLKIIHTLEHSAHWGVHTCICACIMWVHVFMSTSVRQLTTMRCEPTTCFEKERM